MKKFFGLLAATVAAGTLTCFAGSAQAITILTPGIVIEEEFNGGIDEYGNDIDNASLIPNNAFAFLPATGTYRVGVQGVLGDNADYLRFNNLVQLNGPLTFTVQTISGDPLEVNPVLGLYNSAGALIASTTGVDGTASFSATVPSIGNDFFYLGVGNTISPEGVVSVAGTPNYFYNLTIAQTAVPEPTTMLGLGVAGALGFVAKRKRKQETAV